MLLQKCSFILSLISLLSFCHGGSEAEFTVKVGPGATECFFVEIVKDDEFDIEYQVSVNVWIMLSKIIFLVDDAYGFFLIQNYVFPAAIAVEFLAAI